jgi:hypothetical protein
MQGSGDIAGVNYAGRSRPILAPAKDARQPEILVIDMTLPSC